MTPKQKTDFERRLKVVEKYNYDNWSRVLKENYDGFTKKISNTIDSTIYLMKDNFMTLITELLNILNQSNRQSQSWINQQKRNNKNTKSYSKNLLNLAEKLKKKVQMSYSKRKRRKR